MTHQGVPKKPVPFEISTMILKNEFADQLAELSPCNDLEAKVKACVLVLVLLFSSDLFRQLKDPKLLLPLPNYFYCPGSQDGTAHQPPPKAPIRSHLLLLLIDGSIELKFRWHLMATHWRNDSLR